ncbi:DUF423 domain-containing protein [Acetobacter estunensis]|uniref:DUF423 domain-containing protein n=1 Tax=Acetobacter estunensis TaxID=104097 RepID=UPI0020C526ED|nr:DUF423 domain-containing protein [Acetobacter estunensis]
MTGSFGERGEDVMELARFWRVGGAWAAATGVAMGAVAAHLPSERFGLPEGRMIVQEAVQMQMWHALALLALGVSVRRPSRLTALAGCGLWCGMVIFCLALYVTAFSGHHLGSVAPTGGLMLIASWALLGVAFLRHD